MTDISSTSWSETDASNNQTPSEGWPAGMAPNQVEPTARMNMGAVKRFWDRINPTYLAALATTDTYTLTPTIGPGGGNTYGLYERWRIRMPGPNLTSSPTLNISAIAAVPIKKYNTSGNVINPGVGDIQGVDHGFWYDGTEWILENPSVGPVAQAAAVPTGSVTAYAGSSAPSGWLICDGSAVSRTTFASLFGVVSTTYGAGDGSTTFNLPDMRGRIAAGFDSANATGRLNKAQTQGADASALGNIGGEQGHTLTTSETAIHSHGSGGLLASAPTFTGNAITTFNDGNGTSTIGTGDGINANGSVTPSGSVSAPTISGSTGNAGGGASHNNVQPTLILNYIIKT